MRDKAGRYMKKEEGMIVNFRIPSLGQLVYYLVLLLILLPWMAIASKFCIIQKILEFFEAIMEKEKEDSDTPKKNGLFY